MKIRGIKSGMVMQRGKDNYCDIFFTASEPVTSVECNCYCKRRKPEVHEEANGYRLQGIEAGGPYTLKINDTVFCDIYVGDVWLLAGQSNMQGIGKRINISNNNNPCIRAYSVNDNWGVANHPLHRLGTAVHPVHKGLGAAPARFDIRGVGPGLSFAEKMYELTAVPQGIIACAHGGTNLKYQWAPSLKSTDPQNSLYDAMYQRYVDNGSNVKGVFWYQGCSDTHEDRYLEYSDNMINFVECMRHDFQSELPFVQVQIARNSWESADKPQTAVMWSSIREQQRLLNDKIDNFDTVSAIAHELEDCIHLTASSQEIVGADAAESMFCLINGKQHGCRPGIKLRSAELVPYEYDEDRYCELILTYDNVHGELTGGSRAVGFDTSYSKEYADHCGINRVVCDGNTVTLCSPFSADDLKKRYLWYGYGVNPPCNIVDKKGRPIPAFGPLLISDLLK